MMHQLVNTNNAGFSLPVHGTLLHRSISCGDPSHSWPSNDGAGLLHNLPLVLRPPPHVAVHGFQPVHADHTPSSEDIENNKLLSLRFVIYQARLRII